MFAKLIMTKARHLILPKVRLDFLLRRVLLLCCACWSKCHVKSRSDTCSVLHISTRQRNFASLDVFHSTSTMCKSRSGTCSAFRASLQTFISLQSKGTLLPWMHFTRRVQCAYSIMCEEVQAACPCNCGSFLQRLFGEQERVGSEND